MAKHSGRENQAPSSPSAGSWVRCGTTKTPALLQLEPLVRHQQAGMGKLKPAWDSQQNCCLSRDPPQAGNNILCASACVKAELFQTGLGNSCHQGDLSD